MRIFSFTFENKKPSVMDGLSFISISRVFLCVLRALRAGEEKSDRVYSHIHGNRRGHASDDTRGRGVSCRTPHL